MTNIPNDTPWKLFLDSLKGRSIHVVGLASTECTAFLQVVSDANVTIHELHTDEETLRSTFAMTHVAMPSEQRDRLLTDLRTNHTICSGANYLSGIQTADLIFVPQSWDLYPSNQPIHDILKQDPGKICSLIDLYARFLPCKIIGVTGTNGKTTVTSLLGVLLEAAGINVAVSGNNRYHSQLLPRLDEIPSTAVAVLEISHKHLRRLDRGPDIAVVTNVAGDHLEEFGSFDDYAARKARILQLQTRGNLAVVNLDDPWLKSHAASLVKGQFSRVSLQSTTQDGAGAWIDAGNFVVRTTEKRTIEIPCSALKLLGKHNITNTLLALAAAAEIIPDKKLLESGLRTFRGVKHRLEYLRSIQKAAIYDDTASTSPASTRAAIEALAAATITPIVLVVGGDDKNNCYDELHKTIADHVSRVIVLPGSAGNAIAMGCGTVPVHRHTGLVSATQDAIGFAAGGAVLFSPGGGGFFAKIATEAGGLRTMIRQWGR
ncbi:MAG: hypothetical protein HUU55_10205 [Myxococcales bacterium]|nr:hypothetical protein [Myxococcales bacterium]